MLQDRMMPLTRTPFLGVGFHNVGFEEVCREISSHVLSRVPGYMMSLNVDILVRADKDPSFRAALDGADLVLMDSVPLMRIAKRRGVEVREKLAGSDLMPRICEFAAREGLSCFFLGGADGVPERAAQRLSGTYPGLRVAGTLSPKYGFERSPAEVAKVASRVSEARPDILFVCLGEPKASSFITGGIATMGVPFSLSVGAAVDFAAGTSRRAPSWIQRAGFEWLYRFAMEPRRLFKRYFIDSWRLVSLLRRYR